MNRRHFLQAFGTALAGAALDPERLLWVPGKKTICLPAVSTYVEVRFDVTDAIVRAGLRRLSLNLASARIVNRHYGAAFGQTLRDGDQLPLVTIRQPDHWRG